MRAILRTRCGATQEIAVPEPPPPVYEIAMLGERLRTLDYEDMPWRPLKVDRRRFVLWRHHWCPLWDARYVEYREEL